MNQNGNEVRRVPGFTAERVLEQGASKPYAGLALRGGGGAVEPAYTVGVVDFVCECKWTKVTFGDPRTGTSGSRYEWVCTGPACPLF
jgi:hypothetical protein